MEVEIPDERTKNQNQNRKKRRKMKESMHSQAQASDDRIFILTKDDKTALEQLLITTRKMLHTLSYLSTSGGRGLI